MKVLPGRKQEKPLRWTLPLVVGAVVLVLWILNWVAPEFLYPGCIEQQAQFGDRFGAVNALFSGLAFAGLLIAIWLQNRELKLQMDAIQQSRLDQDSQNQALMVQRFEISFFNLLDLYNKQVAALEIDLTHPNNPVRHGRACFARVYTEIKSDIEHFARNREPNQVLESINDGYMKMFDKRQTEIGHYFRTLYNIVKFIDKSEVPGGKQLYVNLLRAQLSLDELRVIFYNSLSDMGRKRFKPLIESYSLFEQLTPDKLIHETHSGLYHSRAFQEET